MGKENLFKRLRSAMGVSAIKDMTPKEIDDVFQSLHDKNVKLSEEVEHLKQRCIDLDAIADTAFKYNHSSAECLRAWTKLQQLRKEQDK